jgi:hypothetical protein
MRNHALIIYGCSSGAVAVRARPESKKKKKKTAAQGGPNFKKRLGFFFFRNELQDRRRELGASD